MEEKYAAFTGLVGNISRCIQKIKNEEMATYGYKGKQVQCLFTLCSLPDGATLTQLCELCDEDKGAMSRTVKELVESGLVYVEEVNAQKYKNPVKLTEKGRQFSKIITEKVAAMLKVAGAGISEREREIMYRSLGRISDNLTQICDNYGGEK